MKKYLVFLSIIITLAFSATVFGSTYDYGSSNSHTSASEFEEIVAKQQPALQAYDLLWNHFEKDKNGDPVYPDNYGGEYINKSHQLVILLVENTEEIQNYYRGITGDSSALVFEKAKYSLAYLQRLDRVAVELLEQGYAVLEFGVDRPSNEFFITVNSSHFQKANSMLDVEYAELPIKLNETKDTIQSTAQLWGGDKITNEDTGGSMSVGIGGTYQGQNAILTCGHGNEKVGILFPRFPYIQYSSSRTGQVSYQRANQTSGDNTINSLGDFSFVTLNSTNTPTNRVWGGVNITGTYSSVPVGMAIYKYGYASKYSQGYVTASSISVTYSDELFTTYYVRGLYQSTMSNSAGTDAISPGDSGGTVYVKDGSINKIHGIVTARRNPVSGPATIMYSSPIYYAQHAGFTVKLN